MEDLISNGLDALVNWLFWFAEQWWAPVTLVLMLIAFLALIVVIVVKTQSPAVKTQISGDDENHEREPLNRAGGEGAEFIEIDEDAQNDPPVRTSRRKRRAILAGSVVSGGVIAWLFPAVVRSSIEWLFADIIWDNFLSLMNDTEGKYAVSVVMLSIALALIVLWRSRSWLKSAVACTVTIGLSVGTLFVGDVLFPPGRADELVEQSALAHEAHEQESVPQAMIVKPPPLYVQDRSVAPRRINGSSVRCRMRLNQDPLRRYYDERYNQVIAGKDSSLWTSEGCSTTQNIVNPALVERLRAEATAVAEARRIAEMPTRTSCRFVVSGIDHPPFNEPPGGPSYVCDTDGYVEYLNDLVELCGSEFTCSMAAIKGPRIRGSIAPKCATCLDLDDEAYVRLVTRLEAMVERRFISDSVSFTD